LIPELGFGTWRLNGRDCEEGVADALAAGYRHVDTAAMYGNEVQVGRGMGAAGVERSEVWVTTKVWPDDLEPDRLRASCERSLRQLGTDHVDLLLIHWPNPDVPLAASLDEMMALRERGLTREIGVSNFPPGLFREALSLAPVIVNQVEYNAFIDRSAELEVCAEHDVELTAWRPVAKGAVADDETIREIAAAHDATPAQVALRWLIDQPRVSTAVKASSPERRRENLGALELELRPEERARIDALAER
jgi:2,5-diketo-D-gluconate reductase B